jgi:hypothetical protein
MKRIPLTQGKFAIVDDEDFEALSKHNWRLATGNYASRAQPHAKHTTFHSIFMHREITNAKQGETVDHINRNPLDNRRVNLRLISHQQNCWNVSKRRRAQSGYIGVYWFPRDKVWYARIRGADSKSVHIGAFKTPEVAAQAYNLAAVNLRGDFAVLNKLPEAA